MSVRCPKCGSPMIAWEGLYMVFSCGAKVMVVPLNKIIIKEGTCSNSKLDPKSSGEG